MAANAFLRPDLTPFQKACGLGALALSFALVGALSLYSAFRTPTQAAPASPPMASRTVLVDIDNGHGSGTYLGDGYYLTANHVVDGQKKITVITDDGKHFDASVLWQSHTYDVAMIHITERPNETAAKIDCAPLQPGQAIHLEGNPYGNKFVRTYGRVASIETDPASKWAKLVPASMTEAWKEGVLVDATLLPGMSGGGTFDEADHFVGVNVGVVITNKEAPTGLGIIVPASTVCMLIGRGTV
jgi:S1-C subfamily serine protease